jgi:hypothetical protein
MDGQATIPGKRPMHSTTDSPQALQKAQKPGNVRTGLAAASSSGCAESYAPTRERLPAAETALVPPAIGRRRYVLLPEFNTAPAANTSMHVDRV